MPSLGSHLAHAHSLAERLGHPYIEGDRGSYYLGATAPDMRVLLKIDRKRTHFFVLDDFEPQDSVASMFEAHPGLATASSLDPSTRAFMAGYVTHLLMDEIYIQDVYRVFFGERSALGGDLWANVLDRALQYEMNRRQLEDAKRMQAVRAAIEGTNSAAQVPFLPADRMAEWREFSATVAAQEPNWDRFPRMMRVHLGRAGFSEEEIAARTENAEELVAEAFEYVSEQRVEAFLEQSADVALDRLADYLAPA